MKLTRGGHQAADRRDPRAQLSDDEAGVSGDEVELILGAEAILLEALERTGAIE